MTEIVFCALLAAGVACHQQPDEVARQIGLEILRGRMIEYQRQRQKSIEATPPGYFMVGYQVRMG